MKSPAIQASSPNVQYLTNETSPCQAIGFALVIILGVGSLAVVGAVYLKIGAFSTLAQVNAITLMTTSGAAGITLLTIGIVGSVKNCQTTASQEEEGELNVKRPEGQDDDSDTETIEEKGSVLQTLSIKNKSDASGYSNIEMFGSGAWMARGVQIAYNTPHVPEINESEPERFVLLLMPADVWVKGKRIALNLTTWNSIFGNKSQYKDNRDVAEGELKSVGSLRWILISKGFAPDTLNKSYNEVSELAKKQGCRLPFVIEMMMLGFLLGADESSESWCEESVQSTSNNDALSIFAMVNSEGGEAYTRCSNIEFHGSHFVKETF